MHERRNIFLHGLGITLRRLPALLWTYVFNLGLALLFSIPFHSQVATLLNHSLAAQRLSSAFDLGTLGETYATSTKAPPAAPAPSSATPPSRSSSSSTSSSSPEPSSVYQTNTPARLGTLLHQGLLHFWRFIRITLLALLVCGLILGPLSHCKAKWADYIDDHIVGRNAFLLTLAGIILHLPRRLHPAPLLRSRRGLHRPARPPPPPHRLRQRTQARPPSPPHPRPCLANPPPPTSPALWPIFLFLTLLGAAAVVLTARIAMHMLAQPRVWPTFLLAQTRSLPHALHPLLAARRRNLPRPPEPHRRNHPPHPSFPSPESSTHSTQLHPSRYTPPPPPVPEPIPNPEPASPSLDEPDPGVFHHDPTKPPQLKPPIHHHEPSRPPPIRHWITAQNTRLR